MNADSLKAVQEFEKGLNKGDTVVVFWTNCGLIHRSAAKVYKVNRESIVVEITDLITSPYGNYKIGQKITAPRLTLTGSGGKLWSNNNRVEPTVGYQQTPNA